MSPNYMKRMLAESGFHAVNITSFIPFNENIKWMRRIHFNLDSYVQVTMWRDGTWTVELDVIEIGSTYREQKEIRNRDIFFLYLGKVVQRLENISFKESE